jgi:hypothetical protein
METDSIAMPASGRDQRRRLGWRSLLAGGVAVVMVAAGAGIGLASIPSGTGVFHGCYVKSSGALRVIDPSAHQHCKKTELAVSWNQAGQRGLAGPRGPRGAKGATGQTGPAGPPGLTFTTTTGQNSPAFSTAGTYFVAVKAALVNNTQSPLIGICSIFDPVQGAFLPVTQPFVVDRDATGLQSFSGMVTVGQAAPLNCTADDAAGTVVSLAGDPIWWVAKVPTS